MRRRGALSLQNEDPTPQDGWEILDIRIYFRSLRIKISLAKDPTICSCEYRNLWSHDTCEGCAEMARGRHTNPATGAFGGAPYGVTKRVRGVPKLPREEGGGGGGEERRRRRRRRRRTPGAVFFKTRTQHRMVGKN